MTQDVVDKVRHCSHVKQDTRLFESRTNAGSACDSGASPARCSEDAQATRERSLSPTFVTVRSAMGYAGGGELWSQPPMVTLAAR